MDEEAIQEKCQGSRCTNPGREFYACPFAEEINDDSETMCNCCEECTRECAEDV